MTFFKRATGILVAFTVMLFGSLSFFPSSFAESDYQFPFRSSDLPSPSNPYYVYLAYQTNNGNYFFNLFESSSPFTVTIAQSGSKPSVYFSRSSGSGSLLSTSWSSGTSQWSTSSAFRFGTYYERASIGSPCPFSANVSVSGFSSTITSFSYSFLSESDSSSSRSYFDYSPFYFPELPYGYFDGDLVASNGGWLATLNFGTLTGTSTGSYSYSESGSGSGSYSGSSTSNGGTISGNVSESGTYSGTGTLVVPDGVVLAEYAGMIYDVGSGYSNQGEIFIPTGDPDLYLNSSSSGSVSTSGSFSGTVSGGSGSESGTLTISSLTESGSGSVTVGTTYSGEVPGNYRWIPSYADHARFKTFAVVTSNSYCYFISDARNRITASLENVSDSGGKVRILCKGDDDVYYPAYEQTFNYFGEKTQQLTQLANGFTVDFVPGTLSQDSDSGKWSVEPLYHGVWFSDQFPSINLSSLTNTENLKWLANPVFGESAFTLNFLDSINSQLELVNQNLTSLQQSISNDISGQTSSFMNADAPAAEQPDSTEMMDYFADSSVFNAPSADDIFVSDADNVFKTGHIYEGVSWWTSKFNDIVNDNAILVSYITTMLTIGLAVLIIGRKVDTG